MEIDMFLKKLGKFYFDIIFKICKLKEKNRCIIALMKRASVSATDNSDYIFNYTIYPKKSIEITNPIGNPSGINSKTAIIIQGVVVTKDDYTLESVKLYKKIFPEALIVVSTWSDLEENIVEKLKKAGAVVILNELPKYTGTANINYQVFNTLKGLQYAKEQGYTFAMKTRTDEKVYRKELLNFFENLYMLFPVGNGIEGLSQKERLIILQGTTTGSALFVPGYVSDLFYFGHIDDLINYFSFPLEKINKTKNEMAIFRKSIRKEKSMKEYYEITAPEVKLYRSYIQRNAGIENNELDVYWKFIREYTIGLSWNEIGLNYYKYDKLLQTNNLYGDYNYYDNENRMITYGVDFNNWLNIYFNNTFDVKKCSYLSDVPASVIDRSK